MAEGFLIDKVLDKTGMKVSARERRGVECLVGKGVVGLRVGWGSSSTRWA